MLVNCNLCQKKFLVPDSAITKSGRLVQCGSCGNKWTQYPVQEKAKQETKKSLPNEIKKNITKKNKQKKILYSKEYLKKKHGLIIEESIGYVEDKTTINKKTKGFGFYSYMITIIIFFIAIFGVLNLSKDTIVLNYPSTEPYINYLYEVIDIIKITFTELVNQFKN
jgi:predicted Zn finger-like uncharacterized protein